MKEKSNDGNERVSSAKRYNPPSTSKPDPLDQQQNQSSSTINTFPSTDKYAGWTLEMLVNEARRRGLL